VVLPFANIGGDPEQDYFVDGVTESLTTDLSRISGSFVIARNTAFTYKGKPIDVKQIGRELNVRYVLEGSVQKGGNRLRVNVQLIDAETGNHLWAERFDKPVADLFDMQDEIVGRLARALQIELINAESQRGLRDRPHDADATDLTMRGWAVINRQLTNENNIAGRNLFEQALALDPDHDEALAGLAYTLMREFRHGWNDSQGDHEAKAISLADRAIALNPNTVLAYIAKGLLFVTVNRLAEALVTAETGLRHNPSSARLFFVRANAKQGLGRHDEAIADYRHAIELSPREPIIGAWYAQIGGNELSIGNYEAVIAEERKALDLGYRGYFAHAYLAAAHAHLGNGVAAREAVAEARIINPRLTMKWLITHSPDTPNFFDGMRKAGLPEG
jgi:TolB-like protein